MRRPAYGLTTASWTLPVTTSRKVGEQPPATRRVPRTPICGAEYSSRTFSKQTQDYFVILGFTLITILVMYRIERSRFGRELAPIGSAEGLAAVSGINVLKSRVFAFAIGAGFAGFAGSLFAHDAAYISSNNFSMWGTIYILVWLVVGGAGKMWGPIVGAVAMTLIAEFLRMSGILQALFYSGVLLVVVLAMPNGIVGVVDKIRGRQSRGGGTHELATVDDLSAPEQSS